MKNLIAISFISLSLTACLAPQEKRAIDQKDNAIAQKELDTAQKVLGNSKGGVVIEKQEMAEYSYAQKGDYTNKMRKELDDIGAELNQLEARIERSTGESKADAKARLVEVQGQWTQTKLQLDRAESSNEASWEESRVGFNKAYQDLNASIIKTRQWISDKIEP